MSIWRKGMVKVVLRTHDCVLLASSEEAQLVNDWQAGKAFGVYQGVYGHTVYIKLAEVQGVIRCTKESIEREDEDDLEDAKINKQRERDADLSP